MNRRVLLFLGLVVGLLATHVSGYVLDGGHRGRNSRPLVITPAPLKTNEEVAAPGGGGSGERPQGREERNRNKNNERYAAGYQG